MLKLFIWETIEESQSTVMNILLPSLEADSEIININRKSDHGIWQIF